MLFPGESRLLQVGLLKVVGTTLENKFILSMSFSNVHAIAVLSNGEALGIGENRRGALGTGTSRDCSTLTLVRTTEKIVAAFAGTDFTLFLTDKNLLLSSGLTGSGSPAASQIQATKLSGCRNTVAIITPEHRLVLWPDFHKAEESKALTLPAKPKSISCGVGFAAVLLENQLLLRIDSNGKSSTLYVKTTLYSGGAYFVAASASDTYIIAIDMESRAWIFGEFNGFSQKTLSSIASFESVKSVFAFPRYAIGVTEEYKAVGIGQLPAGLASSNEELVRRSQKILPDVRINYVAGNDHELVVLPIRLTYEEALSAADDFIPFDTISELRIE
jgi:alpha-tubulin suppressor-like RCC1 family protein